jgi:F0F1-type ATP synthase assembly protein I
MANVEVKIAEPGTVKTGMAVAETGTDATQELARRLSIGLRIQSIVALVLTVGLLLVSPVAAYSSLFGSLAVYVPGMLLTMLVVRKIGGDSAVFLRAVMLGEFGKMALVGLLCALVFIWVKPLAPGYFFTGMITVLAASWVGLGLAFRDSG